MSDFCAIIDLAKSIGCAYSTEEQLCKHSTFKIGGKCELMLFPDNKEKFISCIDACKSNNIKFLILGNGSDIVFGSAGYKGVVISTSKFNSLTVEKDVIKCDAGVNMSALCMAAYENGLSGAERLYGIPGSVGGAVCMNAGAYGGQINDILIECEYYDGEKIVTADADAVEFSYRHSIFSAGDKYVIGATFKFVVADKAQIKAEMNDYIGRRRDKQPLEYPSAGSTFLRPEGHFAGALIEQCGLKGCTVGGAQVSQKHAGFVINIGGATSNDVKALVQHIKDTVFKNTGVELKCEIKFEGEDL